MSIWVNPPSVEAMQAHAANTALDALGIEFLEVLDDGVRARMPVDERTVQPYGILHGGSSVLLAETLGSVAANHCLRGEGKMAVGLDINANHIRSANSGWVYGTSRAIHVGGSTQVWEIRIVNEQDKLVCISRLTMAVVALPG